MGIIITRNGSQAVKLDPAAFIAESHLQSHIADNPECIPVDQIEDGLHLLILGREFPTASGPVDVLAIDAAGMLYLIETKLYKNPDKRRVVAQVLDYGAALWSSGGEAVSRELAAFVAAAQTQPSSPAYGGSLQQRIADTFDLSDEEALETLEQLQRNISSGRLRFMVLMDQLHERLKELILFINENSRFELLAIEVEFYKHDDFEIVIPRLFGAEKRKVTEPDGRTTRWDDDKFTEAVEKACSKREMRELLDWAYDFACRLEQEQIARRSFTTGSSAIQQVRGSRCIAFKFGIGRGEPRFNFPMYLWNGDRKQIESALTQISKAMGSTITFDPSRRAVQIFDDLLKCTTNRKKLEAALTSLVKAL